MKRCPGFFFAFLAAFYVRWSSAKVCIRFPETFILSRDSSGESMQMPCWKSLHGYAIYCPAKLRGRENAMRIDKRKVALVGCGMVGMSYAYCLLNQTVCDELVLIDINQKRAMGEAMDLNHGLAFAPANMEIYAGSYQDCRDADMVVICAGVAQKPGESRLALLKRNAQVFRSIIEPVTQSGFNGIFLVATNPVDIMTRITCELSGFNPGRVLGSGTALDTARLRYLLGEYLQVDPKNVHAYVMGEHGDSEFVPWSQAMVATIPILKLCGDVKRNFAENRTGEPVESQAGISVENRIGNSAAIQDGKGMTHQSVSISRPKLLEIAKQVKGAAYEIIDAKQATYYGIGMAMTRITRAVLGDENSVLTVSAMLKGEYGQRDVIAGVPCVINGNGIRRVLELSLTEEELEQFAASCRTLRESFEGVL